MQMEQPSCINDLEHKGTLKYESDRYDGVIVIEKSLPDSKEDFERSLKHSLRVWKADGRRGIWLKIPSPKIDFAQVALKLGFVMHHAEKDYLMLTHWLSEDENKLPSNASHQVGVGCVVVNPEGVKRRRPVRFNLFSNQYFPTFSLQVKCSPYKNVMGPSKDWEYGNYQQD